jgi:SAM-dependent methyltransferase
VTLDEIAARGDAAVAALRASPGPLDKLVHRDRPELLDLVDTPQGTKQRIVADADRIARMLQLHRLWTRRLGSQVIEARRTRRGKPVRVLDVGAGSGGLLFRLDDWARRRRIPVELHGVDVNAGHAEEARRLAYEEGRRVTFHTGDATRLSEFADGSVDVALSTFMLHHLPPGAAARALAELDRVAAVNFFAFDLRRSLVALPFLWALLQIGRFEAPSSHDAVTSLRRGYSVLELEALLRAAGVANFGVEPVPPAFMIATRA